MQPISKKIGLKNRTQSAVVMSKTNPHPSREGHPRGFRSAGAIWVNESPVKQQGCVL